MLYNCRPIVIVDQPKDQFECELTQATFTINKMLSTVTNGKFQPTVLIESYCKQFNLYRSFYEYFKINQLSNGMNGYKYQGFLSKNGNTCGNLKPSELNGIFIANSKLTCNFSAV
jgi:phage terminase small subunit